MNKIARYRPTAILALSVVLLTFAVVACGGNEEAPVDTSTDATPPSAVSGDGSSAAGAPSPTPPDAAAGAVADLELTIDSDTPWQEVFDILSTTEQSCIRQEFGDEAETLLARPVFSDSSDVAVPVFSCIAPETARALFLSVMIAGIENDIELGEEERACLRGWVGRLNADALIAALSEGDGFGEFYPHFVSCVPDQFLVIVLSGSVDADLEDVYEDELACLREWASGVDRRTMISGLITNDPQATIQFLVQSAMGLLDCAPRLFIWRFTGEEVEFDEEAVDCLRGLFADPDVFDWIEEDSLDERIPACVLGLPASPTNVRYAVEGSTIRVTWDAVDGADFYNVYYDDFFDDACSVDASGPSFCSELATGLTTTSYVHTSPDADENYYWVAACNANGCSEIDSRNPAVRKEN